MSNNQLTAIINYTIARYGSTDISVANVIDSIVGLSQSYNCHDEDIVAAFASYDASQGKVNSNYIDNLIRNYLKAKTAKAIGDIYEEVVEELHQK